MRISDWSSDVCSSDLKVARVAREFVVGDLAVQIAEAQVDDDIRVGPDDRFGLEPIDVGADIVVDRGAGDDLAELQILVFIIEGREVQLERAVAEGVLRHNFERIDLFGPEAFGHFEEDRMSTRLNSS